jgi:hypothetical protein
LDEVRAVAGAGGAGSGCNCWAAADDDPPTVRKNDRAPDMKVTRRFFVSPGSVSSRLEKNRFASALVKKLSRRSVEAR